MRLNDFLVLYICLILNAHVRDSGFKLLTFHTADYRQPLIKILIVYYDAGCTQ